MKVTSAAVVFQVSDFARALAYYRDVLGFGVEFTFGAPPAYGSVQRDDCSIHLSQPPEKTARLGQGAAYFFCDDVDAYFTEIAAKGVKVVTPPTTQRYGMRDFYITDPDGNQLGFGKPLG